jgi:ABC-type amino acid transport substrate-binding protein
MFRAALAVASSSLLASLAFAGDLPEIKASGVLRVIAQKHEAPELFNLGAGEPGFEREVVDGFAKLHGVRVEPVVAPASAERIPMLRGGRGDLIIGIVDLPERREQVSFSGEVLPVRHVALTRKPRAPIRSVEELRAAKVGVVRGTSWARVAAEAGVPPGGTMLFDDRADVFAALKDGRIDATVITLTDGILAMKADAKLEAGVTLGEPGRSSFAVRKGDAKLLAALDEYLGNFRKSPSWNRLLVKYFGDQALTALGRR